MPGASKDVFRSDDGVIVAPAAIEAALLSHPATHEAAVATLAAGGSDDGGRVAKAYVIVADGWHVGPAMAAALISRVAETTGLDRIPLVLEFLDEMPQTESGKIHLEALPALYRPKLLEFAADSLSESVDRTEPVTR